MEYWIFQFKMPTVTVQALLINDTDVLLHFSNEENAKKIGTVVIDAIKFFVTHASKNALVCGFFWMGELESPSQDEKYKLIDKETGINLDQFFDTYFSFLKEKD